MFGSSSEISVPHSPRLANFHGLPRILELAPPTSSYLILPVNFWPSSRVSSGFGSSRSTWLGASLHEQRDHGRGLRWRGWRPLVQSKRLWADVRLNRLGSRFVLKQRCKRERCEAECTGVAELSSIDLGHELLDVKKTVGTEQCLAERGQGLLSHFCGFGFCRCSLNRLSLLLDVLLGGRDIFDRWCRFRTRVASRVRSDRECLRQPLRTVVLQTGRSIPRRSRCSSSAAPVERHLN